MSTMIFGTTPPPPKKCIVCKGTRLAWRNGQWICLDCDMPKKARAT